jgi:hypothetical protein
MIGKSGSSREPSDAGKSDGSSGLTGGVVPGRAKTGGAIAGAAGGAALAAPGGAERGGAERGAGATPTIVFFSAAIVDGGGFAEMVGALCTAGDAGDGTLIGIGSPDGFGPAAGVTAGTGAPAGGLGPKSPPPTPTKVDLSGFFGRGAEAPGEVGDPMAGTGGAIGAAGLAPIDPNGAGPPGRTAGAGFAAGRSASGGGAAAFAPIDANGAGPPGLAPAEGFAAGRSAKGFAAGRSAEGFAAGRSAEGFAAGAPALAPAGDGAMTRNECPHFGQRIFRPAGGTRRSSI